MRKLDGLGNRLSAEDRQRIEAELAERLGCKKPTEHEIAAEKKARAEELAEMARRFSSKRV